MITKFSGRIYSMNYVKYIASIAACLCIAFPIAQAQTDQVAVSSTVLIASYSSNLTLMSWGSGFFVDEAVVVTNKHVINNGNAAMYRIFATAIDGTLREDCYRDVTKSDLRLNLDNDVAYIRAYILCDHEVLEFTDDPVVGDPVEVYGYPINEEGGLAFTVTAGIVSGYTDNNWLRTTAYLDFGNSGGPVVQGSKVLGVAVAKSTDEAGNFIEGYFIPSTVIVEGLLYANDSQLGYTPGYMPKPAPQPEPVQVSSSSLSVSSSSSSSSVSSSSKRSRLPRVASSSTTSVAQSSTGSSVASIATFTDVLPTTIGYEAVQSLVERGVLQGYEDGTFRPQADINRAEFLKILVSEFLPDELQNEVGCFSDVAREWFAEYICTAKRLGWIDGYPDGTFKPAQTINRAEALKIVVNAFGVVNQAPTARMPADVREDVWYYSYVQAGLYANIINPADRFRPGDNLLRQDAALWIYSAE